MTSFDSLAEAKDFLALDAKRSAILVELSNQKEALDALPKDNPSVRSFERIETRIDEILDRLQTAEFLFSQGRWWSTEGFWFRQLL